MDFFNQPYKCTIQGKNLVYYRSGKGEPLLLVHGITTYSFIWQTMVASLCAHFDVIAVDLLGCGDSDKPLDVPYSLKNHAALLAEFTTQLNLSKFHYVGHDLGGGIGQIFAVNHTDKLLDLTLVNSVAYDFWPVQPIIAMRTPIVRQFAMASLDYGTFKLLVKRGVYHKNRVTPELMAAFSKPMNTRMGRKAFLHFAKCLNNEDLLSITKELHALSIPVLLVRGDADPYLKAAIVEKLHAGIPHSRLVHIPTGSHFIQVDEPEQITTHLLNFFKDSRT